MFKDIQAALDNLLNRKTSLIPKLKQFSEAMEYRHNPQYQLKVIHVAGTNGKGSTTDFIRSVCQAQGYKVGTFTSPHLIKHQDRFRINNQIISDDQLLKYINQTYPLWDQFGLTMFEIDVMIAIDYFIDEQVDVAIFEVGLGGQYDATNVVMPIASVITNISLDHTQILGNTVLDIAHEKAGIIKTQGIVVTGEKEESILQVFRQKAQREIHTTQPIQHCSFTNSGVHFTYRNHRLSLKSLALYQSQNAALAYEVCYQLNQHQLLKIGESSILSGLQNTQWAGRFEIIQTNPTVILDGAHNQAGMQQLVQSLKHVKKPVVAVFTALADKDTDSMLQSLMPICDQVIVTQFDFYRRQEASLLANGFDVIIEADWHKALDMGLAMAQAGTCVVCGSLYFISDVKKYWGERK